MAEAFDRFRNEPVDVGGLPQLEGNTFDKIEPSFLWAKWASLATTSLVLCIIAAVAPALPPVQDALEEPGWIRLLIPAIIVLAIVAGALQKIDVGRMCYLVREHDFSFKSGVIFEDSQTIPFARVQNVSINRGFVLRLFGLSSLMLQSAGGAVHVQGLPKDRAEQLKDLVIDRARLAADAEQAERI